MAVSGIPMLTFQRRLGGPVRAARPNFPNPKRPMDTTAPPPPALPNDGGPAFPGILGAPGYGYGHGYPIFSPDGSERVAVEVNHGQSLRDAFAMAAMPALIIAASSYPTTASAIAAKAYAQADAMLEARKY